jgi:hypothetical protein
MAARESKTLGARPEGQKFAVRRRKKLRDGPMALPEKRPPKSITSTMLLRFSPSSCNCTPARSDL